MTTKCLICDEETGYLWDSMVACPNCEKGRLIQLEQDKHELKHLEERCRRLRKKIKRVEKK